MYVCMHAGMYVCVLRIFTWSFIVLSFRFLPEIIGPLREFIKVITVIIRMINMVMVSMKIIL